MLNWTIHSQTWWSSLWIPLNVLTLTDMIIFRKCICTIYTMKCMWQAICWSHLLQNLQNLMKFLFIILSSRLRFIMYKVYKRKLVCFWFIHLIDKTWRSHLKTVVYVHTTKTFGKSFFFLACYLKVCFRKTHEY